MNIYSVTILIFLLIVIIGIIYCHVILTLPNKSRGRYRIVLYQSIYQDRSRWYYIQYKPKRYGNEWKTIYSIHPQRNTRSYTSESLHFNTEQEAAAYIENVLIPEETNPLVEKKENTIISYHP